MTRSRVVHGITAISSLCKPAVYPRWSPARTTVVPGFGQGFYCQGLLATTRVGLTRGVAIRIGN